MSSTAVAVGAGLGAAAAYGLASAVQHDQVGQVEQTSPLNPGLLAALARRPVWLLGIVADGLAVALQAVALRYGPVVLVQLLVVGGLPIAVVLSAAWARQRLQSRETLGLVLCTGGLALAVPASSTVNLGHPAGARLWTAVGLLVVMSVLALVGLAHRDPGAAPLATGVAAGITAGASSVLLAICAARIGDPVALLRTVVPYATIALGLSTLLLSQAAFQTGSIGTPLAALSVTEPAVAVLLAVTALHEHLPTAVSARGAGILGITGAVAGVLTLSAARDVAGASRDARRDGGVTKCR